MASVQEQRDEVLLLFVQQVRTKHGGCVLRAGDRRARALPDDRQAPGHLNSRFQLDRFGRTNPALAGELFDGRLRQTAQRAVMSARSIAVVLKL